MVAKAGSPGGVFVVAEASWWLWEADNFPKSVTHTLNSLCGDSGAFILRESSSIWPRSGSNRVDEGGKSRQPRRGRGAGRGRLETPVVRESPKT